MSAEEVDFWTPTIEAFKPLQLSGPELSPKLLKRPPFRFIADIVTSINTRFAAYDHIFRPDQLDVSTIDNKEKKVEYLTTLVKYVGSLLGQKIDVNVKKIVSGSEPEKTNVFLQCLALAVGYAQQDKARRAQEPPRSPPSPPRTAATSSGEVTAKTASPARSSSPRRASNAGEKAQKKARLMQEAAEFYEKVNNYGHLKLDQSQSMKEIGRSIVDMYSELQRDAVGTDPTSLPEDALETAIRRQMEVLQQVFSLQEENDAIVEKLEVLLSS